MLWYLIPAGCTLAACVAGFFDEVDGLLDAGFEVEPAGLGCDLHFDQMEGVGEGRMGTYTGGFVLGERHDGEMETR